MINLAQLSATPYQPTPADQKIRHAAHEFEGILLNTLLGPLEKTFATLPGGKIETGSDQYQSLATQVLASGLAARGGLGIADLIIRKLEAQTPSRPQISL